MLRGERQPLSEQEKDSVLRHRISSIYGRLQHPRWCESWLGWRHTRAARRVHALFIDVNELTDRTENTLKFIDDIYRFAVEQAAMSRGEFLELTVVVILILELVLIVMGVMT